MLKKLKELNCWLDKVAPILILLLIVLILRIPNFFEPYWYGDEAIYLTIGHALANGGSLYHSIIDHKTPIIYYLAMVPNQLWFRSLNLVWSSISVLLFFFLANRVIKNIKLVYVASLAFALLTSLPMLEGNIPNGELFVMGFILLGGLLFVSHFMAEFVGDEKERIHRRGCEIWLFKFLGGKFGKTGCPITYFIAGFLFGLGILTKVPAIFDVVAFLSLAWFVAIENTQWRHFSLKQFGKSWLPIVGTVLLTLVGVLTPMIISVLYFNAIGHGQNYLDYGLLYNFKYVRNWSLPFSQPWLVWAFSLQGKLLISLAVVLILTFLQKRVSLRFKFVATWLVLSLFASTLSNRPYPHYYLQVLPALLMTIGFVGEELIKFFMKSRPKKYINPFDIIFGSGLIALTVAVFWLLKVGFYPTLRYYSNFVAYVTKKVSREQYYQAFDSLMADNYKAAQIIQQSDDPYLFMWGDNSTLYSVTQKIPTGRFIVSFHVRDFNAYAETLNDVMQKQPVFIVTMNNAQPLPGLTDYLNAHYLPNSNFDHFVLWKRMSND